MPEIIKGIEFKDGIKQFQNAGWPEAAMARTLDIALAGPRVYDGQLRPLAWVNGTARMDIGAAQIDAAVGVLWRFWGGLVVFAAIGALANQI